MAFPTARPWLAALLLTSGIAAAGVAQAQAQDGKTPGAGASAVAAAGDARSWVPARESAIPIRRTVALRLDNASLKDALDAVGRAARLTVAYGEDVLRSPVRVTLRVDGLPLVDALSTILDGTGLDAFISVRGDALLVSAGVPAPRPARRVGAIVGRVTDAKTGLPLSAANVLLKGTKWATTSDSAGRYRLAGVDAGRYTLLVRRLGYAKHEQALTVAEGEDTVNVALQPVATRLDELVTTATGQQRRRLVPNDITLLNVDSIMRTQPIRSVTDLLEGRVPGLAVQHTSGAPGDPSRLRLRGASSPNLNNDPIVVVDGVRIYAQQSAQRSSNLADYAAAEDHQATVKANAYATPSPLDYLDPNSIEKIEVVKGPSAATLYGPDAANGVIVITTKKGRAGPTRWTASVEHGITGMANQYPERTLRWGHLIYSNVNTICPLGEGGAGLPSARCTPDSLVHFQLLNDPTLTVFGHGHRTTATLGASGGTQTLTYNVTGSYGSELGLLRLPDYEVARYEARVGQTVPDWMRRPQHFTQWGVTSQLGARLGEKADLSLTTSLSRADQTRSQLDQQLNGIDFTYFDRASGAYYGYTKNGAIIGLSRWTDVLDNYYTRVTASANQLITGLQLSWRPWTWLSTQANAGLNVDQRVDGIYLPRGLSLGEDSVGRLSDGQGRTVVQTMNLQATVTRPLGRGFTFQFVTRADYTSTSVADVAAQSTNLPVGQRLPGTELQTPLRRAEDVSTFGWALAPSIINPRFSVDLGLRLDGGSAYGSKVNGLKLPTFPKLGFSYLLSDEPFFPFKSLFSSLRLRASYGRAGRQPGPTDRLRLYTTPAPTWWDGQYVQGTELQTLGNTKLRPERSSELEGGVEADLLDSRLSLTVTGYRKTTDDYLLTTPVPLSIGLGSVVRNIGVTRNTGLDLTLGAQLVRSGLVTWTSSLAVQHRRDEVVKLAPGVQPITLATEDFSMQRIVPGYPLFGYWTKPVVGYADLNGDGVISPGEITLADTAVYRGSPLPDYSVQLSSVVGLWHNAVAVTAQLLYDNGMTQLQSSGRGPDVVFSAGANDPNASAAAQAIAASYTLTDYYWLQPVSTTRLNALAVTYNVPQALARRLGAERLSVSLQGSNLGLWSNYRGVDPNVNAYSTGNLQSDTGQQPLPRTWQLRVNATY